MTLLMRSILLFKHLNNTKVSDFLLYYPHMFILRVQNIIKVPLILLVFLVLLFGFLQFGMNMDMKLGMVNCPLMPGHSTVICKMNPLEHIKEWQSVFTFLPSDTLFIFIFATLLFFVLKNFWQYSTSLFKISDSFLNFLFSNNFKIFDPLKEAFSQGLINPKVF